MLILERLQRRLEFAKHKDPPKAIERGAVTTPDTLYLYGVDYMSTFDIKSYFERFASTRDAVVVNWLNDSACLVKFESIEQAAKAYSDSALTSSSDSDGVAHKLHIGQVVVDSTSKDVDERNFDALVGWKEALGFQLRSSGRF